MLLAVAMIVAYALPALVWAIVELKDTKPTRKSHYENAEQTSWGDPER